ncbi:MAG: efflux transporter outer membrane subunit [Hellea sp.]|nr:efflux transporter outer membrane subunit [Hellea sp.]
MRQFWLTLSTALVLTGCQTLDFGPGPTEIVTEVPDAPENDWTEYAADELPNVDWVGGFEDPVLAQLVAEALENNTSIRAARALHDAAIARVDISDADKLPFVSGSAGLTRTQFGFELFKDNHGVPDAGFTNARSSLGIDASWEPDVWGRISDQITSSKLDASAAQADYAGARLAITSQISQTWFNLIEARLLMELAARDVETQERALRLTQRRFESGVAGSSDVRLARSSVANSQALEASRKQQVAALTRTLETLLRRYPADAIEAAADLPALPTLEGAGLPAQMLARRPDLLAAERRLKQQGLSVDVARKALLPRLSLSGGINSSGNGFSSLFDLDSVVANLVGGLTQPLFDGGALKANVRQQDALLRRSAENYAGTVLDAYREVENALDAEQRLAERESALRVSLDEAVMAEDRLERRYVEGLASILQLLDAQSRRFSAESQLISARTERLNNRVRLHVALGGGIYGDESQGF